MICYVCYDTDTNFVSYNFDITQTILRKTHLLILLVLQEVRLGN